jgi:hypothetical protein
MLPQLSQQLLTQWSHLPIVRRRPDRLSFLGVRTGVGDGYALFLTFADRDRAPCLAVKIPRERVAALRLQHEWSMLNHFHRHVPRGVAASLPRPILWKAINGTRVLVTTAPSGQPMRVCASSFAEHFARVGDWLVQLACATRATRPAEAMRRGVGCTAERLGTVFDLSGQEMAVVEDWIAQGLAISGDGKVELFAAHGNFHHRSIWLYKGRMTVVNWEQSRLACLPLQDIFAFITTYRFPAVRRSSKEGYLRAFRETYLTDAPYADVVSWSIARYCEALGIPLEGVEACLGIFLAYAALREYDQLQKAADRGYLPLLSASDLSARGPYRQAIKDQVWINLLRLLVKERTQFKPASHPGAWERFRPFKLERSLLKGG